MHWSGAACGCAVQVPLAGWYPDPQDVSFQRWWNGQAWAGEVRSAGDGRHLALSEAPMDVNL